MSADTTMASGRLSAARERRFWAGMEETTRFFMGEANVQKALEKLVARLEADRIPYAIVGAMALNEIGYRRATVDVDVLLTPEGLERFKRTSLGRGYLEGAPGGLERTPGGFGLRDAEHGVDIDVVLTGGYPGDGKPKPVAFPNPAQEAERGARVALLPPERLIELKLASGMTAPHRLRDLADVQELIRIARLPRELAAELDPYVRAKYLELWEAVREHGEP